MIAPAAYSARASACDGVGLMEFAEGVPGMRVFGGRFEGEHVIGAEAVAPVVAELFGEVQRWSGVGAS